MLIKALLEEHPDQILQLILVFTPIRDLFAKTQESRTRGYGPGRFSFNVKGGRCEACEGDGVIKLKCISCQTFMSNVMSVKATL